MSKNYFEISGLTPGFAPLIMALCRLFKIDKDKRPDLKQFMLGFCTQQDGLPVWGEGLKGNTSDKKWNLKP